MHGGNVFNVSVFGVVVFVCVIIVFDVVVFDRFYVIVWQHGLVVMYSTMYL